MHNSVVINIIIILHSNTMYMYMYVLSYKHINKLTDLPRHVRVCNDVMIPYRIQMNVQCCCLTDFIFVGSYYKCIAMVVGFLGMA